MEARLNKDVNEVLEDVVPKQLKTYVWKCQIGAERLRLEATAESEIEAKKLVLKEVGIQWYRDHIIEFFSKPWAVASVYGDECRAGIYTDSIPVFL